MGEKRDYSQVESTLVSDGHQMTMKPRKKGQRIDKEEIASFQSKISAEENGSGGQDKDTELPEMVKRDLLEEAVSPENTMEQGIDCPST